MVHEKFLIFIMVCNFLTGLFGMMVHDYIGCVANMYMLLESFVSIVYHFNEGNNIL